MDAGGDPVAPGRSEDRLHRLLELGMGWLERGRQPRRRAPVVRADVARVDPRHGEDRVDVLDAVHVLDLSDDKELVVRALEIDRKSTRLNSSHLVISYAVFCL